MSSKTSSTSRSRQIKMIVAYSRNRTIGRDNTLPWRLPGDLKHFKQQTLGHPIIMGRRTWESLGRPLPGRLNVVVSSSIQNIAGASVARSLDDAIALTEGNETVFIIGGANLYAQALEHANEIVATEIDSMVEGDAHFPELDPAIWHETERQSQPIENDLNYDFVVYRKK